MANKVPVSLSFPVELIERLDRLARAEGKARSVVVRELIEDAVNQRETVVSAMTDPVVAAAMGKAFSEPGVMAALVASLRQQLTDKQLQLFERAMGQITTPAAPPALKRKGKK